MEVILEQITGAGLFENAFGNFQRADAMEATLAKAKPFAAALAPQWTRAA
jgi:hypothetical protein